MKKYIVQSVIAFILIVLMNVLIFLNKVDPLTIISNAFICVLVCAVVVSFFSIIVRFLPKKIFNHKLFFYHTFKWEIKFYDIIGIKNWKEKIPEMGKTGGFSKSKVEFPKNRAYLEKFLFENCLAEFIHVCSFLCDGLLFLFLPIEFQLSIGLPVFLFAGYLNILPAFVQRYLRPKLIRLYDKAVQIENRNKIKESEQ